MGSFVRRQQSSRTGYFLSICTVPRVEKVVYPAGPSLEDAKTTASDIQLKDFAYFIDLKNLMIIVAFWYYCMPTNYPKIIEANLKGFPK